jgi:ankyrin repeat protein
MNYLKKTVLLLFFYNITSVNADTLLTEKEFYELLSGYNSDEKITQIRQFLQSKKVNINKMINDISCEGLTALQCTSSIEIMKLLIENGADIDLKAGGFTPLEKAAMNKDGGISASFLLNKGAKPTPFTLYNALWYENFQFAEELLDLGVNPNYIDKDKKGLGYTNLVIASQNGYSIRLIKKLVEKGANPKDLTITEKLSPLHFFPKVRSTHHQGSSGNSEGLEITSADQIEKVRFLVDKGADIDAKSKYGFTPFLIAAEQNEEVALYIMEKFPKTIKAVSTEGLNALHLAASGSSFRLVKKLVETGIDVNSKTKNNETPIFFAATTGNAEVIKYLISKGADCTFISKDNDTALTKIAKFPSAESHYQYLNNHEHDFYEALELLLQKSKKELIHKANKYGDTPWFLLKGWMFPLPEKIRLFLKYGAIKETKDKQKKTLLQLLQENYNENYNENYTIYAEKAKTYTEESIEVLKE